jgi:hypothetical protein
MTTPRAPVDVANRAGGNSGASDAARSRARVAVAIALGRHFVPLAKTACRLHQQN